MNGERVSIERPQAPRQRCERGQGMVEFVIILIFIMAMCAGMISSIRLLGFQYWAQQEARFLAFEQTWAPHDFYGNAASDAVSKLNDSTYFGRPNIVTNRTVTKSVDDDEGLPELLSWMAPLATERADVTKPIRDLAEAPTMLASTRSSWLRGPSSELLEEEGAIGGLLSPVSNAYAHQTFERSIRNEGFDTEIFPGHPEPEPGTFPERLGEKLRRFFHTAEVGPAVCDGWRGAARRAGGVSPIERVLRDDCEGTVERGLAREIAENVNVPDFVRGYEYQIQSGFTPPEALENVVRAEVAEGFYSFYDSLVKVGQTIGFGTLLAGRAEGIVSLTKSEVTSLLGEFRYLGSNLAIAQILGQGVLAGTFNPTNRSAQAQLDFERSVIDVLHEDVGGSGGFQYFLSPTFLPVPPLFGAAGPAFQEAIMRNAISQPEDSDLRDELVDNSNKMVEVTYRAQGGLFRLATEQIRGAETAALTGRFYLVTQEWHQRRRRDNTGPYREKGTQFDSASDETEEAVMRRRVLGLWLIPTDIAALLQPISFVPGLGVLGPVLDALQPISTAVGFIKRFITDNPLFQIAQALSEIPVIGDIVPVPPMWPAVRPDAYPGSVEMTSNDPDKKDRLMHNEERDFVDYVEEQRKFNPAPDPDFGESD